MQLEIPDEIVKRAEANAGELLLALAIQLYSDNRIDYTDALRLAGIEEEKFDQELVSRGLSIHKYPPIQVRRKKSAAA